MSLTESADPMPVSHYALSRYFPQLTPARLAARAHRYYRITSYRVAAAKILKTVPLQHGTVPVCVLSMVQQRDVRAYLVAIKSFAQFICREPIVVVCDPSMTQQDRQVLRTHIPHVELRDAAEFLHAGIPVGGTWERLHAISHYAQTCYVVQLEADTITLRHPSVVNECIVQGTAFVIGEEQQQAVMSLAATPTRSHHQHPNHRHVQCVFEAKMAMSTLPAASYYVRGCSGFTGFPQSSTMQAGLLVFAKALFDAIGERWSDWGTEQVASNYLVANLTGLSILSYPDYGVPIAMAIEPTFVHFIGSQRYGTTQYADATAMTIRKLRDQASGKSLAVVM